MITQDGDTGHKISNKLLINTMNQYFVVYTVRFSVDHLSLRADFLECTYVRIIPDFLSCRIFARGCSHIRLYCSSMVAK